MIGLAEEMQYNFMLTSLYRQQTLTLKGKGTSHLIYLMCSHAMVWTWFFMCVSLCPCESKLF